MLIQLLKNEKPVLTAKTDHSLNKSHNDFLPVVYQGDTSLLLSLHEESTPKILYESFFSAAGQHNLSLGGDFDQYIVRKSVTLPNKPSQEYLDKLSPDDIIY